MADLGEALDNYRDGAIERAASICKALMTADPNDADAIHLAGLCQWQLNERDLGVELLRRAARLRRDDATLQYNLGSMELDLREFRSATERFMRALTLAPDTAEYHYKFGVACERIDQPGEAERAYLRALQLDPRCGPAYAELSALLERGNRIEEAEQAVERALELNPTSEIARMVQAQLVFREGNLELAEKKLRELLSGPLGPANEAIVRKRLGGCLDRLGKHSEAFEMIAASNRLTAQNGDVQGPGWYTMEAIARIRRESGALLDRAERSLEGVGAAGENIVFLVGFPRSGTTLLDQMLDAHESLLVLEEKTTMRVMLTDAFATPDGVARLCRVDDSKLDDYRAAYWKEVKRWLPDLRDSDIVIDKLPLNTVFMPLLHLLFPAARFIFALRDPRDSVLSCFMSSFGMNESMRHFVSLETAAEYYAAVMGIAVKCLPRLGSLVHFQRYEDLILRPEEQQAALCEFLGVKWNDSMLEPQKYARGKRINTPSYHQVAQPLYRRAVGRWQNYRRQMNDILPVLAPFVERWGYET